MVFDGVSIPITASFGVALSRGGATGDTLLRLADEALYRAKAAGRNRVETALEPARPDERATRTSVPAAMG